jgi:hypothetical protein
MLVALYACDNSADTSGDVVDEESVSDASDSAESDTADSTPSDLDDATDVRDQDAEETSSCLPSVDVMCPCDDDETVYCCDGGGQVYHCNVDGYWSRIADAYCGMSEFPENIICPWRQH